MDAARRRCACWATRRDASLAPFLAEKLAAASGQSALELLWALNLSGGLMEPTALKCLDHADAQVRLWTARLLCDANRVSPGVAEKLARLAVNESNIEARAQLACSARRLPAADDFAILRGLLSHDEDAEDERLPLLIWWAIEARAEGNPDQVLALFRDSSIWERPIVRRAILERVMRRYAATGLRKDLLICAALLDLAPSPESSRMLMSGFEAAYKGRPMTELPEELLQAMSRHQAGSPELALRRGEPAATEAALKILANEKAPLEKRREYAAIIGEINVPASVPVLLDIVEQSSAESLRKTALGALGAYGDSRIPARVLQLYPRLEGALRPAAELLLTSRAVWSAEFINAVEAGQIKPEAIPRETVRRIRRFTAAGLDVRAEKVWGPDGRPTTAEMNRQIERLAAVVRGGAGDPHRGRELFRATCGACHTLHGEGGHIGPDLSGYNRGELNALLVNIVNPNAEIREGYENYLVTMKDGRVLNGFLAEQDPKVVVLRGLDGQNIALARDQIAEMKNTGVSLMPEGLLNAFDDRQARDFFAYLQSDQPLPGK